jgi:hypothetical protein
MRHLWPIFFALLFVLPACGSETPDDDDDSAADDDDSSADDDDSSADDDDSSAGDIGTSPSKLEALCVNSEELSGPGLQLLEAAPSTEVVNPISGAKLPVFVIAPSSGSGPWPVVVLVPGGIGSAAQIVNRAGPLVSAGVVTVLFDPDGRGAAEGEEDQGGEIHQAGLGEVIRLAALLPCVDLQRLGVFTSSYGITMGSGALANDPSLPAKFLIDWEGPANRDDTGGCDADSTGHLKNWTYEKDGQTVTVTCDDEEFWAFREASTSIDQVQIPYYRFQGNQDHAQPDHKHTILMVNNALAGSPPEVFLNHQNITQAIPEQFPDISPGLRMNDPIADIQATVDWINGFGNK